SLHARSYVGKVIEFKEALNKDESRFKRESDSRKPSEQRIEEDGIHGGNLPLLLATHLGRIWNGQPQQLPLTFGYGGNQPLINLKGNPPPNGT
nr:hypothetical protein [Tanacetum cinerariifolium]